MAVTETREVTIEATPEEILASAGSRSDVDEASREAVHWVPPALDGFLPEYVAAGPVLDAGPVAAAFPLEPVASGVVVDLVAATEPDRPQA